MAEAENMTKIKAKMFARQLSDWLNDTIENEGSHEPVMTFRYFGTKCNIGIVGVDVHSLIVSGVLLYEDGTEVNGETDSFVLYRMNDYPTTGLFSNWFGTDTPAGSDSGDAAHTFDSDYRWQESVCAHHREEENNSTGDADKPSEKKREPGLVDEARTLVRKLEALKVLYPSRVAAIDVFLEPLESITKTYNEEMMRSVGRLARLRQIKADGNNYDENEYLRHALSLLVEITDKFVQDYMTMPVGAADDGEDTRRW